MKKILTTNNFSFVNQKGFSLISALISTVIVGVATSAMFSTLSIQHKEAKIIQQQLVVSELEYGILQTLKSEDMCLCLFGGNGIIIRDGSPTTISEIKNTCAPSPEAIAMTGETIGNSDLVISELSFMDVRKISTKSGILFTNPKDGSSLGKDEYDSTLLIQFDQSNLVRPIRDIRIPIHFTKISASGEIFSCGETTDRIEKLSALRELIENTVNEEMNTLGEIVAKTTALETTLDGKYYRYHETIHDSIYAPRSHSVSYRD